MGFRIANRISESKYLTLAAVLAAGILLTLALAALTAFTSPWIAAAVVVALIGAAALAASIELALYAVLAVAVLLPFAALPVNIGFIPTLLDIVLVAVFTLWIFRRLMRSEGDRPFALTSLGLPVLIFTGLALFAFVLGMANAGLTIYILRHFAEVLIALAFFFLVANLIQTRGQLSRVIQVMLWVGFTSAALGILFYFLPSTLTIQILSLLRVFRYPSGPGVLRYIEDNPDNALRAISTTVDPNVLGGLMVLMSGLILPQVFADQPLLPRRTILIMAGTMFLCLVLTFSRGALLGLVVLALVAALRYRWLFVALVIGALVFYFAPFTQNYVSHLQDALLGADRATQMRLGEYKDALTLISRNPWFGVGFTGTPDIDTYIGVSSVYLLMAEEMGLVGLAAFLVTMALYYFQAARAYLSGLGADRLLGPILLGLTTALLGSMTAGLFDHYFFNLDFPHSVTLFWAFVGLGIAAIRIRENRTNDNA